MPENQTTLVDRILAKIKNNPAAAILIVSVIAIGAAGSFWKNLPDSWRSSASDIFVASKPDNGWIFVGYQNFSDQVHWSEGPYAEIIGTFDGDPTRPFPVGSRIRLNHKRELIIINFKETGGKLAYIPPPRVHAILSHDDRTGSILDPGTELTVRDVWIGNFPKHDYAVWVRVVPAGTAD